MKNVALSLAAVIGLVFTAPLYAAKSHIGQPHQQHINLTHLNDPDDFCSSGRAFYKVNSNGKVAGSPFEVPEGKILVITDVNWLANGSPANFVQGRQAFLRLRAFKGNGTETGIVYTSAGVSTTADHESSGVMSSSDRLVSGVRVGSSRALCATVFSLFFNGSANHTPREASIYGYLIDK